MPQINVPGRVSVIVFVYNEEMLLAQTLESIVNQTHEDLEIIIVDDGSTDNCMEIAREILEESGRLWSTCRTSGPSAYTPMAIDYPMWAGVAHSTGEFISFMSGNDLCLPDKYRRLSETIGDHPTVFSNSQAFTDFNVDALGRTHSHVGGLINPTLTKYFLANDPRNNEYRCRLTTASMLIRKDLFMRMRNYIPFALNDGWDGETGLMLAAFACGEIPHLNERHTLQRAASREYLAKYGNLQLSPGRIMEEKMSAQGYRMSDISLPGGKYNYLVDRFYTILEMGRDRIERET